MKSEVRERLAAIRKEMHKATIDEISSLFVADILWLCDQLESALQAPTERDRFNGVDYGRCLPCPFCGWGWGILEEPHGFPDGDAYKVECQRCKASTTWWHTEEQAVDAWNSRTLKTAPAPAPAPQGEALRELVEAIKAYICLFGMTKSIARDHVERAIAKARAELAGKE